MKTKNKILYERFLSPPNKKRIIETETKENVVVVKLKKRRRRRK